ncbi:MAG: hypothetical protein HY236_00170, partial [Acidobacteria bacterium]|nr:hypothetical protein [Acidobacteriota bacterium]
GGALLVKVVLTNRGGGHMVPTGSPLRRLHLEVRVNSADGKSYQQDRVYRRTVADAQGREIQREHQVFMLAAKEVADTRLKPEEQRVENFSFPVPRGVSATVRALLWYYYSPLAQIEQQKKVNFFALAQYAPAEAQQGK